MASPTPPAALASAAEPGVAFLPRQSGAGTGVAAVTVTVPASDAAEGRRMALDAARRAAAARGLAGEPRVTGEGMSGGHYLAVVEFGPQVPAPVTAQATPSPGAARPGWILVVPAEMLEGGRALWGRESAWSRSWAVPARLDGMSLVSTMGDADDRKRLAPAMIADPDSAATGEAARWLGRKYGAPSVAMVLREPGGGIRACLWRTAGGDPESSSDDAPGEDPRATALEMVGDLAAPEPEGGEGGTAAATGAAEAPGAAAAGSRDDVDVEEHPEYAPEGLLGFAIVVASEDVQRSQRIRDAVARLPGVTVRTADADADGAEITGSFAGDRAALVAELSSVGISASAGGPR
jgi:hypothetical protein